MVRQRKQTFMADSYTFKITTTSFDEHYSPANATRLTTNFANLARGPHRQQNLRNAFTMIDRRFNDLAHWDNPNGERYTVTLEIVSATLQLPPHSGEPEFPLLEMLDVQIVDHLTGTAHRGIVGNSFSSYIRDYDFSVLLPAVSEHATSLTIPDDFGDLHGNLFQRFLDSDAYQRQFTASPVICISVSTSKTYRRTENHHPVLGVEYEQSEYSLTDEYFRKMGLRVRYFLPPGGKAPLAYYFQGDLLGDYSVLQLIGTISTMETFQKIYRPEIYNMNAAAAAVYQPKLDEQDYSRTQIGYDREERSQLAKKQGFYAAEHLIEPHGAALAQWVAAHPADLSHGGGTL